MAAAEGEVVAEVSSPKEPTEESPKEGAIEDASGGDQQPTGPTTAGTSEEAAEQQTPPEPAEQPSKQPEPEKQPDPSPEPEMPLERNEEPLIFETPKLPVRSVVVFLDRAEVARTVKAEVQRGLYEVILKNLSPAIDKESIRVEGSGDAIITEVAFQTKSISSTADGASSGESGDVRRLRSELEEQKKERLGVADTLERVTQQRNVLDQFADRIVEQAAGQQLAELVSEPALEGIERFFTMFEEQAVELDEYKMRIENRLQKLDKDIENMEKDLREMKAKPQDSVTELKELSILLEAKQSGEIELHVSYVVSDASWSPKYDVRVGSQTKQMQIQYFGMIQQSTGEDWNNAKVALSTAMPSIGGQAPELTSKYLYLLLTEHVGLKKSPSKAKSSGFFRTPSFRRKKKAKSAAHAQLPVQEKEVESEEDGEGLGAPIAAVSEGITSTTYEIANPTNIPADNSTHKVSVAAVNLTPHFEYETVPKLAAHAFLKAKAKNESPYAFLEGPANVFLDNNFVTKSSLPPVSPSEEFDCSLGVDASVRVSYQPLHRFQEQGGFVSKTRIVTFHQQIEITNLRQDECKIKVTDQLPRSGEEKIKVKRLEPEIPKADPGQLPNPRVNASNNIEWMLTIPATEKRELTVRYNVEYPTGQQVEGL